MVLVKTFSSIICVVVLSVIICFFIIQRPRIYVKNYYSVIGLRNKYTYLAAVEIYGEPTSIILGDNDNYFTAKYDGYEFICSRFCDGIDAFFRQ